MTVSTTDRLEARAGQLLRATSVASSALLALGLAIVMVRPDLDPRMRLLQSGLIVLLAGPVARVALSAVTYARSREWYYAGLALTVFAVLILSVAVAFL